MPEQTAIALLADVVGSTNLSDRQMLAGRLQPLFQTLNSRFANSLMGAFDVEKGIDEFGALLRSTDCLADILVALWLPLHPYQVRVSLAFGLVDVNPDDASAPPSVRLFDGPVFHKAADGLEWLEKRSYLVQVQLSADEATNKTLTYYANLLYSVLLCLKKKQVLALTYHMEHPLQSEVAARLGVSQPAVSEMLGRINAPLIVDSIAHLNKLFDESTR